MPLDHSRNYFLPFRHRELGFGCVTEAPDLLPARAKVGHDSLYVDRAYILAAYLSKPGIWERGIKVLAVATDAVVHRLVEILLRPIADTADHQSEGYEPGYGTGVGRIVRRLDEPRAPPIELQ